MSQLRRESALPSSTFLVYAALDGSGEAPTPGRTICTADKHTQNDGMPGHSVADQLTRKMNHHAEQRAHPGKPKRAQNVGTGSLEVPPAWAPLPLSSDQPWGQRGPRGQRSLPQAPAAPAPRQTECVTHTTRGGVTEEPSLPREFMDPPEAPISSPETQRRPQRYRTAAGECLGASGSRSASSCHTNPHACEHRLCVCICWLCFQMLLGMFFLNNPAATPLSACD